MLLRHYARVYVIKKQYMWLRNINIWCYGIAWIAKWYSSTDMYDGSKIWDNLFCFYVPVSILVWIKKIIYVSSRILWFSSMIGEK
jgi:hypothetical protein